MNDQSKLLDGVEVDPFQQDPQAQLGINLILTGNFSVYFHSTNKRQNDKNNSKQPYLQAHI